MNPLKLDIPESDPRYDPDPPPPRWLGATGLSVLTLVAFLLWPLSGGFRGWNGWVGGLAGGLLCLGAVLSLAFLDRMAEDLRRIEARRLRRWGFGNRHLAGWQATATHRMFVALSAVGMFGVGVVFVLVGLTG